ncbi:hypothetical protein ACH4VS_37815 [Streptomyces hygroscopicus]|uniref:hypothetical protein n=1 Tax=Streptomyces TaxID=1883 RepID=UPI00082A01AA|nr:hypothetical protein [Streptomyces hygroscopicus]GLV79348.1 hypothetical protein Shyhy02_73480 [Streptomyces hygroscopicus subsp. hygroscopicus]
MTVVSLEGRPRAAASTPVLTLPEAERLVRDWLRRLRDGAAPEELSAHFANGMRLELPERIVRGPEEFADWWRDGAHHILTGLPLGGGALEVTLSSPVHAQVVVTLQSAGADSPPSQEWWVVLRDGIAQIRAITVTGLHPEPLLAPTAVAAPEPAHA